ncbi:MAG: 30S ribosomal protein S6 [Acidimicrobiia bacterium]|nr:30S ribosomal protein S6 [Acidimicrobiia bacterium]
MPGPQGGDALLMRAYELMIILEAELEESIVQGVINRTTEMVAARGGSVPTTDKWGRRRFAYEIDHKTEGFYVVLEIVTEASDLDDVDRFLRLADETIRHKIIRLPDKEAARRGLVGGEATPATAG